MTEKKKVLVGISGGVDSAYAVKLLLDKGYEVLGAGLVFSDHTDIESVKKAASELSIPLVIHDCRSAFEKHVIDYFARTYLEGGTPNPCAICNRYVKMEELYRLSLENRCDYFATGHYAMPLLLENGRYTVRMANDTKKDQSYMLWGMTQAQLSRFIAPLAECIKGDIKKEAEKLGISSAGAKESQDICFIKGEGYAEFIEQRYGKSPEGNLLDIDGRVIGRHKGILNYTVGQRRGLGTALGYRAYVSSIDSVNNTVTLAPASDSRKSEFFVENINLMAYEYSSGDVLDALVKIRYSAKPVPVRVVFEKERARVIFKDAPLNPAPGQSAVFYDGDMLLFGGIIKL